MEVLLMGASGEAPIPGTWSCIKTPGIHSELLRCAHVCLSVLSGATYSWTFSHSMRRLKNSTQFEGPTQMPPLWGLPDLPRWAGRLHSPRTSLGCKGSMETAQIVLPVWLWYVQDQCLCFMYPSIPLAPAPGMLWEPVSESRTKTQAPYQGLLEIALSLQTHWSSPRRKYVNDLFAGSIKPCAETRNTTFRANLDVKGWRK